MAPAPNPNELLITNITEETGYDAQNKPQPMIRVTFTVGRHGPFIERFPKAQFNVAAIRPQLNEFAAKITALQG